ncbi:hypothetical protein [Actinokineospora sp. HUAS TT18]|uniref:hypothetical protein n=1 Tax=Actinokineospora sp. HUAS TT18 TaxID=3447451 RepID=UPI003F523D36
MDPEDLTHAFRAATDTLEPRPGFTTDVLRGGKRRQVRHRMAIAGGLAALVGITGGTAALLSSTPTSLPGQENQQSGYDFSILDGPTQGDLAGDNEYLARVIEAWRKGIEVSPNKPVGNDRLTGSPKVIWAGTTPAGKAAIVGQAGETTDRYISGDGSPLAKKGPAFGLVTGEQPTLVNEVPLFSSAPPTFLFGPQDVMLISLDPKAVFVSAWAVGEDGKGKRDWQNVNPSTDSDIRLFRLPNGTDPRTVRVTDPGGMMAGRGWTPRPSSSYAEGADRQSKPIPSRSLDWPQQPLRVNGAKGAELTELHDAMVPTGMVDALEMAQVTGFQTIVDLPDGRSLVGFEYVPDFTGSRFYAAVTDRAGKIESITYGGKLAAGLPAKVKGDWGWLVAYYDAALRYRTSPDGPWTTAGRDAALLPANATEVEVTADGKQPKIVTL